MSKLFLGSIDLTKINKNDIKAHENGAKYLSITMWVNEEPDKYGNNMSIKAGSKESSYYIGNAKEWKKEGDTATKKQEVPDFFV